MIGRRTRTSGPIVSGQRPYQWPPLRAFNAVAGKVPRIAPKLGGVDELEAVARARTGLDDLGDASYRPALESLHAALGAEAHLTPAGRFFARGAILGALANRLRIEETVAADPVITSRPVGPALVVVGLPRSGTTLLQNLLALDPANRSLRQWEATTPAPPPALDAELTDPRPGEAERRAKIVDRIAPAAVALHPTGPRLPTECVTLFANSFASLELGVIYQVPSYTRWCLDTDMAPHYAYYARQLQLLARHDHRERWALKCPAHLFWMRELLAVLPQARVVQLHRDPTQVIGSFCSLAAVLSATNSRDVDLRAIGSFWSQAWADGVTRAEQARADAPADTWLDLQYESLVADPVRAVRDIYAAFGFRFTDAFAGSIAAHVAANPQHKGGKHAYALGDFGLDPHQVRGRFDGAGHLRWQAAS